MKKITFGIIFSFIFIELIFSCTFHGPFSGEPTICFKKKCRAKRIIARRISKNRPTLKKNRFHVKSFSNPTKSALPPSIDKPVKDTLTKDYEVASDTTGLINTPDTLVIDIRFDFDSYQLSLDDEAKLSLVTDKIKLLDYLTILICGHTDSLGSASYNMQLSERRAILVKDYMIGKGFSANKLKTIGYGSNLPLTSNSTQEEQRMNRRVEFKIIQK